MVTAYLEAPESWKLGLWGVCAVTFTGGSTILKPVETTQNCNSLCKQLETEPELLGGGNTPEAEMGPVTQWSLWVESEQAKSVHRVCKTPYLIWKRVEEEKHRVD